MRFTNLKRGLFTVAMFSFLSVGAGLRSQEISESPLDEGSKTKGRMVSLVDFGTDDLAYLTLPENSPRGGIVLVPDVWGLDSSARQAADAWAARGFLVVAVDFYNGLWSREAAQAAQYNSQITEARAQKIITACIRVLRESPRFKMESVGLIGRGQGGVWTLKVLGRINGLQAAAIQHGDLPDKEREYKKIKVPLLVQLGRNERERAGQFHEMAKNLNLDAITQVIDANGAFTDPLNTNYNKKVAAAADAEIEKYFAQRFSIPKPNPGWIKRNWEKLF